MTQFIGLCEVNHFPFFSTLPPISAGHRHFQSSRLSLDEPQVFLEGREAPQMI